VPALEGHLDDITDLARLDKLLVDLGLAQNEEVVQAAIRPHLRSWSFRAIR